MGRPKIEVEKTTLIGTITDAENEQTFASRGALYEFVGEVLNVPAYVIRSRVLEWGLESSLKTPLGKRGRPANPNKPATVQSAKATAKTAKPVSEPKTSPEWDAIVDAFAEEGIEVKGMADILTLRTNTDKQNEQVTSAWHLIRELYDCPAPKKPTVRNRKTN